MPRRIHLEEPTKRSRQRRGRRKESLRAKGYLSDSGHPQTDGRRPVSGHGNSAGRDDVSLLLGRGRGHARGGDGKRRDADSDHRQRGMS